MIRGSCLCKKIAFEAEELGDIVYNCHCSRCRKSHGAAFATQVFALKDSLNYLQGQELVSEFPGDKGIRTFCSVCGSRLMNYGIEGIDYLSIAVSAIDSPTGIKPIGDCFINTKLDWTVLDDSIEHFDEYPVQK